MRDAIDNELWNFKALLRLQTFWIVFALHFVCLNVAEARPEQQGMAFNHHAQEAYCDRG